MNSIVEESYLPVSIIIIGLRKNDFAGMDILDAGDNSLIDTKGRTASRT